MQFGVAFPCMTKRGCPRAVVKQGTPDFCPCWQETTIEETNIATQETRFMRGCYFKVALQCSEHVIHASNRPAAEIGAIRGEVANAVQTAVIAFFATLDPELVAAALAAQQKLPPPNGDDRKHIGAS